MLWSLHSVIINYFHIFSYDVKLWWPVWEVVEWILIISSWALIIPIWHIGHYLITDCQSQAKLFIIIMSNVVRSDGELWISHYIDILPQLRAEGKFFRFQILFSVIFSSLLTLPCMNSYLNSQPKVNDWNGNSCDMKETKSIILYLLFAIIIFQYQIEVNAK